MAFKISSRLAARFCQGKAQAVKVCLMIKLVQARSRLTLENSLRGKFILSAHMIKLISVFYSSGSKKPPTMIFVF